MEDETLEALWKHVEEHWENPAAHRALLEQCSAPAQLAELAKRYRAAASDPSRGELAQRQISAIATMAMAQLDVSREERPSSNRGRYLLIAFFLIGSGILYWSL